MLSLKSLLDRYLDSRPARERAHRIPDTDACRDELMPFVADIGLSRFDHAANRGACRR